MPFKPPERHGKPPERPGKAPAKPGRNEVNNRTYAPPTPKVSRQKPGKVLSATERAAFLAARPDLKLKPPS